MLGDEVVLDVDKFALGVDPLECVAAIAVIESPANGRAVVTEEHQTSVVALRCVRQEIKNGIVVYQEVGRVTSLRADHVGTLDGVTTEEDREVEANNVVVALAGVELDGKTTRVACFVWVFPTNGDRTKADKDWCLLADTGEEVCFLCAN